MTHHITDEQIDEATKDIGLQSPFARYRIARAVLALAAPAPQGEPIGEIVRSFSNGSGLDVRLFGRLTSDTPGIAGTKLYTAPAVPSEWRSLVSAVVDEEAGHIEHYHGSWNSERTRCTACGATDCDGYVGGESLNHWPGCKWVAKQEAIKTLRAALTAAPTPPAQPEQADPVLVQHRKPIAGKDGETTGYTSWIDGKGLDWWPHRYLYACPTPAQPAASSLQPVCRYISEVLAGDAASGEKNIARTIMHLLPLEQAALGTHPQPAVPESADTTPPALHPDDAAVDRFAIAMKTKLAASRAKGRGGWDDPAQCSVEHLARLLVEHVAKGDPVDVANFAMMLHQRGADHAVLAAAQQPAVPEDVAREPMTETDLLECLIKANCLGIVHMSHEHGPYCIDRPSHAAARLKDTIEAHHCITSKAQQPAVPEDVAREPMTQRWCWWIGDAETFHIADTESEAHGEAQCCIDDDCEPGDTREYSVGRVQHPIDALGVGWLAEHVAETIAENTREWCDDNTGAEDQSITLAAEDRNVLGTMVAAFLREKVSVHWWTADQKTITTHTYVAGSNDAEAARAAEKGGES